MKKYGFAFLIFTLITLLILQACKKKETTVITEELPYHTSPYPFLIPEGFPEPPSSIIGSMTIEGVDLGRHFFYDPILSSNGLSCSSCHNRQHAFSSPYFTAQNGDIISVPPHINLAWNPDYSWNGSIKMLDSLCLDDFEPAFFDTNKDTLYERLKNSSYYTSMFYKTFGITSIASLSYEELKIKICFSISQFMRTLVSHDTKYEKFIFHHTSLNASEMRGFIIFNSEKGDCFHCHGSVLGTDNSFHNTGLDSIPAGFNAGRYNATHNPNDIGKFSSPTLRNIELTAPYMHDGRFQTLEEVIEFYNSGVHKTSPNIDPLMTLSRKIYGLELTAGDKLDLLNFLKTFTDTVFINNPAYSSPF